MNSGGERWTRRGQVTALHGSSEGLPRVPRATCKARAEPGPAAASPVDTSVGRGGSRLNLWAKVVCKWGGCRSGQIS